MIEVSLTHPLTHSNLEGGLDQSEIHVSEVSDYTGILLRIVMIALETPISFLVLILALPRNPSFVV